jgi:hypothetical protein
MIGVSAGHLGYIDKALEYFEKGREARDPIILSLRFEHWMPAKVKEDPRFSEFISKFNFPS